MDSAVFSTVSTLELLDPVGGNCCLDWSKDGFISVATKQCAVVCSLDPLIPSLNSQLPLSIETVQCYSDSKPYLESEKYIKEDKNLHNTGLYSPNYLAYLLQLDIPSYNTKSKVTKLSMVSFSPSNTTKDGSSILAVLTYQNEVFLYAQKGIPWHWKNMLGLSSFIQEHLNQNESSQDTDNQMMKKQFENSMQIVCLCWSNILTDKNGKTSVILATVTKSKYLMLWKISLPFSDDNDCKLLKWIDLKVQYEFKVITFCNKNDGSNFIDNDEDIEIHFCLGCTNGVVMYVACNGSKNVLINEIWSDQDYLLVSSIKCHHNLEKDITTVVCSKGCITLFLQINKEMDIISHSYIRGVLPTTLINLCSISANSWMVLSEGGGIATIWIRELEAKGDIIDVDQLVLVEEKEQLACPITFHSCCLSPNNAFVAVVSSWQKVVSNTQIPSEGFLEIKTNLSCQQVNSMVEHMQNTENSQDLLQLLGWYLLQGAEMPIQFFSLYNTVPDISNDNLHIFWYLYKVQVVADKNLGLSSEITLEYIEKVIIAKQMLKVLKVWDSLDKNVSHYPLPVKTIVGWLQNNDNLLDDFSQLFITDITKQPKFQDLVSEICSINQTELSISEDAKFALDANGCKWTRCCLTFCALQFAEVRKCRESKLCSLKPQSTHPEWLKEILNSPSPFTEFKMF